jgi:A/G-specific adenine glycosylase
MAQQTQLDRVVPRFEAFVARFPTFGDLAAASEDDVLEAWSGLGYYRRARLLHRLAREVAVGGGELPTTAAALERLPGIGPYTSAAVASMVFGEPVALVDGNVARVGARFLALSGDPKSRRVRASITDWMADLMTDEPPGEVNEGLMELGALVCTPSNPCCDACPLNRSCLARFRGAPGDYPSRRAVREPVRVDWVAAVAETPDGRWLLRRVGEGPILRGLWLPPFAEIRPEKSIERQAIELLPFEVEGAANLYGPLRHAITHRRIEVTLSLVEVDGPEDVPAGWGWADPRSPKLPTSSLLGKLHRLIHSRS